MYVVLVCDSCEQYQVSEWRQVHADGDHAAGEAELAEPSVSLRKKRGEVEPTTGENRHCCEGLGSHQPLKHTDAERHREAHDTIK